MTHRQVSRIDRRTMRELRDIWTEKQRVDGQAIRQTVNGQIARQIAKHTSNRWMGKQADRQLTDKGKTRQLTAWKTQMYKTKGNNKITHHSACYIISDTCKVQGVCKWLF